MLLKPWRPPSSWRSLGAAGEARRRCHHLRYASDGASTPPRDVQTPPTGSSGPDGDGDTEHLDVASLRLLEPGATGAILSRTAAAAAAAPAAGPCFLMSFCRMSSSRGRRVGISQPRPLGGVLGDGDEPHAAEQVGHVLDGVAGAPRSPARAPGAAPHAAARPRAKDCSAAAVMESRSTSGIGVPGTTAERNVSCIWSRRPLPIRWSIRGRRTRPM